MLRVHAPDDGADAVGRGPIGMLLLELRGRPDPWSEQTGGVVDSPRIEIERIKLGHPQQNGRHERVHLTLKKEATKPAAANVLHKAAAVESLAPSRSRRRKAAAPRSVADFPEPPVFARMIEQAGFPAPALHPLTFGVCTIYLARIA